MTKILVIILLSIFVLLGWIQDALGQEESGQSPSLEMPSLIEGDSCMPPCWFGLEAGESTLEDVRQMFADHPDAFWNDLVEVGYTSDGLPIIDTHLDLQSLTESGSIDFFYSETHFRGTVMIGNVIRIGNDGVDMMAIKPTEVVSVSNVLNKWKQPDLIRAGNSLYYDFLLFYYRDPHLIVQLNTEDEGFAEEVCDIADLMEPFRIEHIYYLSPATYIEQAKLTLPRFNGQEKCQRRPAICSN